MRKEFDRVLIESGGDETVAFGPRTEFCLPTALYEVSTLARITEDRDRRFESANGGGACEGNSEVPRIVGTCSGTLLAVIVRRYLSLFNVEFGIRHVISYQLGGEEAEAAAVAFLPGSDLLLALTTDGQLYFYRAMKGEQLFKKTICPPFTGKAVLTVEYRGGSLVVAVVNDKGEGFSALLDQFQRAVTSYNARSSSAILRMFNKHWRLQFDCQTSVADTAIISAFPAVLAVPAVKNGSVQVGVMKYAVQGACRGDSLLYDDTNGDGYVASLTVDVRLLLLVRRRGWFELWDAPTLMATSGRQCDLDGGEILKCALLDANVTAIHELNIVMLVATGHSQQVQVRSLKNFELLYSLVVSSETLLIREQSPDGNIFFIEPVGFGTQMEFDSEIRVRAVVEARSEVRLERLLNRCKYDEAESFAKAFDLDLQIVHRSRINNMVSNEKDLIETSAEQFEKFMHYLQKVTDHNWVGEVCIAGATIFHNFSMVVPLLEYTESITITDAETKEKLTRLRYNFASYRMLYNIFETKNFNKWMEFVADESWESIFVELCNKGLPTEARVVWCRYRADLVNWIQTTPDAFPLFLSTFANRYDDELGCLEFMELAENEVIPTVLMCTEPSEVCKLVVEWLFGFCAHLEAFHSGAFPENALFVARMFYRVADKMLQRAITPRQQAQVGRILSALRLDSEDESLRIGQLNVYASRLEVMANLKKVYQCQLSYTFYKDQTVKSICFMIMDRVRSVQLIKAHIDRFVVPYMKEYKLPCDETLYRYILKMSYRSLSVMPSEASLWDHRSLAITESIQNRSLRCKAAIRIARRAHPPWSPQLTDAILRELHDPNIEPTLAVKLKRCFDRAELGKALVQYKIPFVNLDRVVASNTVALNVLSSILGNESVVSDPIQRLSDAFQIVELVSKIRPGLVEREECAVRFCEFLARSPAEQFRSSCSQLRRGMAMLSVRERHRVAVLFKVRACLWEADECDSGEKTDCSSQLHSIDLAIFLLETFSAEGTDVSCDIAELLARRSMIEVFGMPVNCHFICDTSSGETQLRDFMGMPNGKERTITEILNFGSALNMSAARTLLTAAEEACKSHSLLNAVDFAVAALQFTASDERFLTTLLNILSSSLLSVDMLSKSGNLDEVVDIVEHLLKLSSSLVHAFADALAKSSFENLSLFLANQKRVIFMHMYLEFFSQVIRQCVIDEVKDERDIFAWEMSSVFAVSESIRAFSVCPENAIFDKYSVLSAVANLARFVATPLPNQSSGTPGEDEELERKCSQVLDILTLSSQHSLEFNAQSLFASIPQIAKRISPLDSTHCAQMLFERIISSYPTDFTLAAAVLSSLPADLPEKELSAVLQSWASKPKQPQAFVSAIILSHVVEVYFPLSSGVEKAKEITALYERSVWSQRLRQLGVLMPDKISVRNFANEFIRARASPFLLAEICTAIGLDVSETLFYYGLKLASLVQEESVCDKDRYYALIMAAFEIVQNVHDVVTRLFEFLMSCNPYDYELICLIVEEIKKRAGDDVEHRETVHRIDVAWAAISVLRRESLPCDAEIRWYVERQRTIEKLKDADLTLPLGECSSALESVQNMAMESAPALPPYSRSPLPSLSVDRLPFHPFIYELSEDVEKLLLPIIYAEVTLHNVEIWQTFAASVPELCISPSDLTSKAVMGVVRSHIDDGTDVSDFQKAQMRDLLASVSSRRSLLRKLFHIFKSFPICAVRVTLLKVGVDVMDIWLSSDNLQNPLSEEDRMYVEGCRNQVLPFLQATRIDWILRTNDLIDEATIALIYSPSELIFHILSNRVDWANVRDRMLKLSVVEKIAAVHETDVLELFSSLLRTWLTSKPSSSSDKMGFVPLPLLDPSLSRIIYLVNTRRDREQVITLSSQIKKIALGEMSTYETKIQGMCCLMRILNKAELEYTLHGSVSDFCTSLENALYGRQLEVCDLNLTLKRFLEIGKDDFIRTLLKKIGSFSSQNAYLAACVFMDFEMSDAKLLDALLTKLHERGERYVTLQLLRYCSSNLLFSALTNPALCWSAVAEWMFDTAKELVDESAKRDAIRCFFYFCLSCPIEGGMALSHTRSAVNKFCKANVASHLMKIAAWSTRDVTVVPKWEDKLDLRIKWCDKSVQRIDSSNGDVEMRDVNSV